MSVANLGTREVRQLCCLNKSNSGTQPYQQDRFYDPAGGLVPALAKNLEGFLILCYEEERTR